MAASDTTLTHVYGVASLIAGLVGIVVAVKADAPWSVYALIASGWVAALFLAAMLVKAFNRARDDAERLRADGTRIGELTERLASTQKDLANRTATLDYIAGLQMGATAIPRVQPQAQQEGPGNATEQGVTSP